MLRPTISAFVLYLCAGVSASPAEDRYPRATWDEYTNASVNISVYVFRDINRNGVYDMGDRPMSGIIVDARGNRKTLTTRSNMSGFANFEMSASDSSKDITFAGRYEFTLVPPPGWAVTTGNAVQVSDFELLPGSPADIVAPEPPLPVGLAPDLFIAGRVANAADQSVQAVTPAGEVLRVTADDQGRFEIPVTPGDWSLATAANAATGTARHVSVGNVPIVLSLGIEAEEGGAAKRAVTVGFDDLKSGSVFKVPSGYGGLDWYNFVMAHEKVYGVAGYRNNLMSGEFVAYNGSGHPASISSSAPFDFIGGFVGVSNMRAEGETLLITAWRDQSVVQEEAVTLSALGPVYFAADFLDVTRVEFRTEHYWQATFDDLAFRLPN